MNARRKNRIIVTLFLFSVLLLTAVMTYVVGPVMMAKREQVAQDKVLFKCQKVIDGRSIEVQMRGWERPNPNPVFPVFLAGINTPPQGEADAPEVTAWAEAHDIAPEKASAFGDSVQKTLLAFIRKQSLFLYREDGSLGSEDLEPGSYVHVFISGSHVNLKLIRSGLALHDPSRPHAHSELYAAAEAQAKADKVGIWGE